MTATDLFGTYVEALGAGLALLSGIAAIFGGIAMWFRAVAAVRHRRETPESDETFYANMTYSMMGLLGCVGLMLTGHLVLGLVAAAAMYVASLVVASGPQRGNEESV